jgi:predicted NBD/HSP70 family sugar kinase
MRHTTRDLRRRHQAALLSYVYHHGPVSRVDLMVASGLSSGSVSNVVSDLISQGMIVEVGSENSDGGRPRTLLRVRPDYGCVVGVDIGETHVQAALFDWTLHRIATSTAPMDEASLDPDTIARLVVDGVEDVVAQAGMAVSDLLGVGVGVPGSVQPRSGYAVYAPTLGWFGAPLYRMLTEHLTAPVYLDNCARTLGQVEMWRSARRGAGSTVVALLAVGVGAAVTAGSDAEASTSTITEWGHMVIQVGGAPCRCGSQGCLEAYVGADAILARYEQLAPDRPLTATGTEQRLGELVQLAAPGGPASDVLEETAQYLGIGIGNLVNMLSPDLIVLAGWASAVLGPAILPAVRRHAQRHALAYLYERTQIELGSFDDEAVALGAATLPVVQVLESGGVKTAAASSPADPPH